MHSRLTFQLVGLTTRVRRNVAEKIKFCSKGRAYLVHTWRGRLENHSIEWVNLGGPQACKVRENHDEERGPTLCICVPGTHIEREHGNIILVMNSMRTQNL